MIECAKSILQNNRSLETNEMTMSIRDFKPYTRNQMINPIFSKITYKKWV